MREMQMQGLRMIVKIARKRRISRGDKVRRVSVGMAVGRRRRVQRLCGREVSKILVLR
jgi:hypothetical protein